MSRKKSCEVLRNLAKACRRKLTHGARCSQACSGIETQERLRAERLDLMLAATEASVVILQAKQSHIPTHNLPEHESGASGKDSTTIANGSTANGND